MSTLIYLDTSAALKRVFVESESIALRDEITAAVDRGSRFICSALVRIEVARAVRRRLDHESARVLERAASAATDDLAIAPIDERLVESARIIGPPLLRSLDAIHLATAIAIGVSEMWTYDDRLAEAAEEMGIPSRAPRGAEDSTG